MTLPALAHSPRHAPPPIVLVDDDPGVCRILSLSLCDDFHVTVAHSGAEALRLLDFAPRALIADWHLPDIEGAQLLEAVHARLPRLPIVVITGDASFATSQAVLPHARALFAKPVSANTLVKALHDATAASATELPTRLGSLRFDALRARVSTPHVAGVSLTAAERRVFSELWACAGDVVAAEVIAELATGLAPRLPSQASDVARRYIHQLRQKLGAWVVETDRRRGYRLRFTPPPAPTPPHKRSEN